MDLVAHDFPDHWSSLLDDVKRILGSGDVREVKVVQDLLKLSGETDLDVLNHSMEAMVHEAIIPIVRFTLENKLIDSFNNMYDLVDALTFRLHASDAVGFLDGEAHYFLRLSGLRCSWRWQFAEMLPSLDNFVSSKALDMYRTAMIGPLAMMLLSIRHPPQLLSASMTMVGIADIYLLVGVRRANLDFPHSRLLCSILRPTPARTPGEPSTGNNTLILALQALEAANYAHAASFVNKAMEQDISWETAKAKLSTFAAPASSLWVTYLALRMTCINPSNLSLLDPKLGEDHERPHGARRGVKAFECFEEAIKRNPQDPDIYYLRGQVSNAFPAWPTATHEFAVLFITSESKEAADNYAKSSELDDAFVFSHIQLAVALYKMGELARSMVTVRRTMTNFPQQNEP
ncbi:hypothetical protein DFJ58DRAFT_733622 [Suillus subalutaceus]|uniref:uncharacterized protein n=1 Tax=Suillus subalutaceus TaxID=48586 RepID=UPI001B87C870|nr:uncharacterized protein DFJ58DRAFT_733622 [Suillus subalutaceus]KAG1838802.1 hypothetical protein DFJ58DRAFT_733622 [Suillus subalutaceus]